METSMLFVSDSGMMLPLRIKLEVPDEELHFDEITGKHVELCNVGELYVNCDDELLSDASITEAGLSKGRWHNIRTYARRCQKLLPDATGKSAPQVIRLWQDEVKTSISDKAYVSVLSKGLGAYENGLGPETDTTETVLPKGYWRNVRTYTRRNQKILSADADKPASQVIRFWQNESSTSFLEHNTIAPDTGDIYVETAAFPGCETRLTPYSCGTETGCWRNGRTYTRPCQEELTNGIEKSAPQVSHTSQEKVPSIVHDSIQSEGLDGSENGLCSDADTTETVLHEGRWHNIRTYTRCQKLLLNATSKPAIKMERDEVLTSFPGTARTSLQSENLTDSRDCAKQKPLPSETSAKIPFPVKVEPVVFASQPEDVTFFGEVSLAALTQSLKQELVADLTGSNTQSANLEYDSIVCKRQSSKSESLEERMLLLAEQIAHYRAVDAERKRRERMNESPEKRARRLAIDAARKRMQRATRTRIQERRDLCMEADQGLSETGEREAVDQHPDAGSTSDRLETPVDGEGRRQLRAERMRIKRLEETPEESHRRRAARALRDRLKRMAETPQQAACRRAARNERDRLARSMKAPEMAERRRKAEAERKRIWRMSSQETAEQRKRRLAADAERKKRKRLAVKLAT